MGMKLMTSFEPRGSINMKHKFDFEFEYEDEHEPVTHYV